MRKVLIANRGEIAVRIARACRDAGLASVAVYASADRDAVHVRAADEAVPLNGATPAETYLDMSKVLQAAADCGADALHPGYGFLAESAEFAQAALDAGLTWIGPPPSAIRRLGDKLSARQAAREAGAPLLPAMTVPASNAAQVAAFAREHGLPVAVKAASGGGGKGVAVARSAAEIPDACARAMRASAAANGRGGVLCRALPGPCAAHRGPVPGRLPRRRCGDFHQGLLAAAAPSEDRGGGTRSVPARRPRHATAGAHPRRSCGRRAAPARRRASSCSARTARSPSLRRTQGSRSRTRSAKKSPGSTWSGSHSGSPRAVPWVTVIRRYAGMRSSSVSTPRTRAAASPRRGGPCATWRPPSGPGVRLDSGTEQDSVVAPAFGTLLAKLIVTGASRAEALQRARRALHEFEVTGLATSLPLHRTLVAHEAFAPPDPARPFSVHTGWVESNWPGSASPGA